MATHSQIAFHMLYRLHGLYENRFISGINRLEIIPKIEFKM